MQNFWLTGLALWVASPEPVNSDTRPTSLVITVGRVIHGHIQGQLLVNRNFERYIRSRSESCTRTGQQRRAIVTTDSPDPSLCLPPALLQHSVRIRQDKRRPLHCHQPRSPPCLQFHNLHHCCCCCYCCSSGSSWPNCWSIPTPPRASSSVLLPLLAGKHYFQRLPSAESAHERAQSTLNPQMQALFALLFHSKQLILTPSDHIV